MVSACAKLNFHSHIKIKQFRLSSLTLSKIDRHRDQLHPLKQIQSLKRVEKITPHNQSSSKPAFSPPMPQIHHSPPPAPRTAAPEPPPSALPANPAQLDPAAVVSLAAIFEENCLCVCKAFYGRNQGKVLAINARN